MDLTKPLVIYTKKQEWCQAFASDARSLITIADTVQTGVTHVVATEVMREACHRLKCIPQVEHNHNRCKSCFNDAFNKLKDLNVISTNSLAYGMHNIHKHNFVTEVTAALDNLVSAAMSITDAIKTLLQSNKHLAKVVMILT